MNGLDIYIQSSSYGEGFPNVVAEAMVCGVSCEVTDVGDAAFIVGKTGVVISPNNSIQLANALEKTIRKIGTTDLKNKSYKSRLRIKENFDIIKMIKLYNKSWIDVYKKNKIN